MHPDQEDWDEREPEYEDDEAYAPNDEGQKEDVNILFDDGTTPGTGVDSLGADSDIEDRDGYKGVHGLDDLSSDSNFVPDAESDAELSDGDDD
ncbi:uncharacterized protein BHQ10_009186 [Talaromyces amestolkiae]|uniref:Uncharacterized protein n=1 Tax=Talaromyces amestolkiae TaxID=1196081 RepID=A0A364LBI4_TALAM|nr:uncharacterized protein BHQ10_009186 [Talaromyces amestolkiae]RAO73174.1 hypothetical protein BHQ10_009186 [Talaromyces amestolkiae]